MNGIIELLSTIKLPKNYKGKEFVMADKYAEDFNYFIKLLRNYSAEDFEESKRPLIVDKFREAACIAENVYNSISNVLDRYEHSEVSEAQTVFDSLMDKSLDLMFISSIDSIVTLKENGHTVRTHIRDRMSNFFYRIRAVKRQNNSMDQDPYALFHIPYGKRSLSSNERFSLAGFPCLYLSSSLPLAWQECGYPQKYYYSQYQYVSVEDKRATIETVEKMDDLRFLSILAPHEILYWGASIKYSNFELWLEVIYRYLAMYPFILACSYVNISGGVPFKQEYVIPQMLMQWVIRNADTVQGITYFSCIDDTAMTDSWNAYNVAIPAIQPYDEEGYSQIIKNMFVWTRPQYYQIPVYDEQVFADIETLKVFLEKVRKALCIRVYSESITDYLREVESLACNLLTTISLGRETNSRLFLSMMNSLQKNNQHLQKYYSQDLLKKGKEDLEYEDGNEEDIANLFAICKEIMQETSIISASKGTLNHIIQRYLHNTWNSLSCSSYIKMMIPKGKNAEGLIDWFRENHILFFVIELEESDDTVKELKETVDKAGVQLSELWDEKTGDDEWIKNHIRSMKSPVFVKVQDTSIYSKADNTMNRMVVGFDEESLLQLWNGIESA